MGFWEDASPAVKGTIVVGGLAIVYFVIAFFAGLPPYGGGASTEGTQQTRGISASP
jgi:hypothetical protein